MILCNELVSNNEDEKENKSECVHPREAIIAIETVKSVQMWSRRDVHVREMLGNRGFTVN